ncbi:hypothetical protein FHW58_002457 [Duganella sp. 1224]|uniref:DUF4365 domain-containing protein n=1 Tax=Duganella sp. 1224 TaxID=2587052 RepID=UPI0015CD678D|nr:DUF4365 domain-containing protein [Duganella sp. 1224]NYE61250.1 hypothetical protein [Duganella sp. 1224]
MVASKKDQNAIGERGESIFFTRITALHGPRPLFKPAFLGDKWAVADYAIELVGHPGRYFLVQVKATTNGVNAMGNLKAQVEHFRYQKLVNAWIPTYVVGVDDSTEEAYVCATRPLKGGLSSIKTSFPLRDPIVRQQLYDEVLAFWKKAAGKGRPWTSRLY